jgi:NADH-quinone oxidoreductase subunit L
MDPEKEAHVHESPSTMTVPLLVLAVLSVVGGWIGLPHGFLWGDQFGHFLAPAVAAPAAHGAHGAGHAEISTAMLLGLIVLTTGVAVAGIFVAWRLYGAPSELPSTLEARFPRAYALLAGKYYVDEIYDALFIRPYVMTARFFWKVVDGTVIEGVVNGVGSFFVLAGRGWTILQTGNVQHYALAMLIGAVCTAGYYWLVR